MSTYVLRLKDIDGNVLFRYDENGKISSVEIKCDLKDNQASFVLSTLPVNESNVYQAYKGITKITVIPQKEELTFENFWIRYNNKVGKKTRAENIWKLLSEEQKILAMAYIPKYNTWLSGKTIEKCYPETYLSQKRWENEF